LKRHIRAVTKSARFRVVNPFFLLIAEVKAGSGRFRKPGGIKGIPLIMTS